MKFAAAIIVAGSLASSLAFAQSPSPLGEAHARSAMTVFGCSNISALSPGPNGSWHGQCSKGGAIVNVAMDSKGVVTAGNQPTHETEAMARSAATSAGCSSISLLHQGPNNSWHGQCAKGGATVNLAVDSNGTVTTGQPVSFITENNARSILTSAGCSSISTLSAGSDGSWFGQCAKGGKTSNVSVDPKGAVTVQ